VKVRLLLNLLILITLVFNQVAASIHVVEHITPVTSAGYLSAHADIHSRESAQTLFESQSSHHLAHAHSTENTDSADSSCLFYHVLLATPCALIGAPKTALPLPGPRPQLATRASSCIEIVRGTNSIRGPPDTI